ncbi:MAG: DUF4153 domain-containing protein [Cyclobacteriaceae bacterium]|nr:DUF4153 domain-containing protein [Cyclobacteriaceae bacterium SS2]
MKLPSLQYLIQQAAGAFLRHPMVIVSAAVAVFFAIFLVEHEGDLDNVFPYINLLLCGYLGVPLFVAVDIYVKVSKRPASFKRRLYSSVMIILLMVYYYLPGSEETLNVTIPYIRYTILAIAAHLLVAFIAFLLRGTLNGFWNFNKALFLRFLLSALYSATVYLGLVLALFALDNLFQVDVDDERYAELFFIVAGVFNTWFFVAGLPSDYDKLDADDQYPKGLRTFILYVLIPLIGLYFLILYSYSVKIIVGWNWPSGIIVYMIIAVAVLGILAMLLGYPFDKDVPGPIKFLKKGYYWVLIPMIVMLYLAIGIRVADYGITINRYITIMLAVWLTGISIYKVLGGKDIRVFPISLFVIILLCSFGPWGMFRVSESSQVRRLESILTTAGILDGKIQNEPKWDESDTLSLKLEPRHANEGILSDSLHNEVYSILDYLEDFHGLSAIEEWFEQNPRQIAKERSYSEDYVAMELIGLEHIQKYTNETRLMYPSFYAKDEGYNALLIDGFDYLYTFQLSRTQNLLTTETLINVGGDTMSLQMDYKLLHLSVRDQKIKLDLDSLYNTLKDNTDVRAFRESVPRERMTLELSDEYIKVRLLLTSLFSDEEGIQSCSGKLLIKWEQDY